MLKTYFSQLRQNSTGIVSMLDMIGCSIRYGASPNNYRDFGFNELKAAERATYVTNRLSRKLIKKYNQKQYIEIFEDKLQFAKVFSKYFGRSWISTKNLDYRTFLGFVKEKNCIIYKPIANAQGKGIKVFDDMTDTQRVYETIQKLNTLAILEEWIPQHPLLSEVYPDAVNCLRIITFRESQDVLFLQGGVTWGSGGKIANACAAGIVSPVNFETGILEKPAADFGGGIYKVHPVTKKNLVGIRLPFWNEVKEMLCSAALEVPQVRYVGWDIAITPKGPILIEGNTSPGYKYYQIPAHMENKCGNRLIYERCLSE